MSDTATSVGTGDGVNAELPAQGMTWRRLLLYAVVLFLVWVVILGVWQGTFVRLLRMAGVLPPDLRPPFRVSTETTGITAPLDKYGWPDYVAAFNAEQSKGVTPETNFVVALREILGDHEIPGGSAAAFDAALGLPQPITAKPLFRRLEEVLSRLPYEERLQAINEDLDKAMIAPWTAETLPHVAELVDANHAAFDAIAKAAARSHFFQPIIPTTTREDKNPGLLTYSVWYVNKVRNLLRKLVAYTTREDERLSCRERMEGCLVPIRVGRLLSRPRMGIHVFVQDSYAALTVRGLSVWLGRAEIVEADLDRLLSELDRLPPRTRMFDVYDSNELNVKLDALVYAARRRDFGVAAESGGFATPAMQRCVRYGALDWNAALAETHRFHEEIQRIQQLPLIADQRAAIHAMGRKLDAEVKPWRTTWGGIAGPLLGNARTNGRRIAVMVGPFVGTPNETYIMADVKATARDRLLRLAIAIRRHQLQTGAWPTGLGEVTGAEAVGRADPCVDGGELIYRVTADGFVIYSVGENGRDDRGENADTAPGSGADDIAIRVRLAQ
jgi:hypothetical protein